jgi:hypothetical protein
VTRVRLSALLLAVVGCSFRERALEDEVLPGDDAGSTVADARPPADAVLPDARRADAGRPCEWELPPTRFDPCALPPSNGTASQGSSATYDTDTGITRFPSGETGMPISAVIAQANGPEIRVLVWDTYIVDAPLRVVGSRPLLLIALESFEVRGAGVLDVSADGAVPGPGGGPGCGGGTGDPGDSAGDDGGTGGGGGGGGHGAIGGFGGFGVGSIGSGAGTAAGSTALTRLHGGCAGGPGGAPPRGARPAAGGGGGAVHVAARRRILVTDEGRIVAAGGGGRAGEAGAGGGGGGAGGAIMLEAPEVIVTAAARLCANGGSGGEGSGAVRGADGRPGTCDAVEPAITPDQSLGGGNGGRGGVRGEPAGGDGAGSLVAGGGGGGGAVGRIRVRATALDLRGTVTPIPVTTP